MTIIEEVCGLLEGYPDVPRKRLEAIISKQTKIVQKITGLSFSGVTEYTELHDGTGHEELMLDRRPVISLIDIQVLSWPYTNYTISPSSIQVVGDMGMLRVRNLYDVGFQPVSPVFPKGRMNVKVVYSAGFATPPEDVATAISLLTFADALGQVAGQRGDATSLSVEGWSKSYGNPRGRYGNVRNDAVLQARALLRSYTSSVVGP
jgi:hypothetical protein